MPVQGCQFDGLQLRLDVTVDASPGLPVRWSAAQARCLGRCYSRVTNSMVCNSESMPRLDASVYASPGIPIRWSAAQGQCHCRCQSRVANSMVCSSGSMSL
ncbi:hypothetical protein J6590_006292 [Homalodisca vitripennis]|nr:hypothetical protein J6590_006292 [Homalodisca vitripennis]